MRVVMVSHRYPPDGNAGVERSVQALATELVRGGDWVGVVARRPTTVSEPPRLIRERTPAGLTIHRLAGGVLSMDCFLLHHERLEPLLTASLLEIAPHVVHIHHLLGLPPRLVEIARRLGAAVILSLHDFYFACPLAHLQKPSGELCGGPVGGRECAQSCFAFQGAQAQLRWGTRTAYYRRILTLADRVICPSQYVASFFEAFGADPARMRVIPNGVALERDERGAGGRLPHTEPGALRLAFCGWVVPHKGVHLILDALRVAALSSVDLLILGEAADAGYVGDLQARAAAIPGLRLRLHGAYNPSELPALLRDVDCAITPSQVPESFSLTTREALALGIPVIAARIGALPEAIVDGENGFLFDPTSPAELGAIFRRLARDPSLLARLRKGAQESEVFTLAEHARAVRAVYDEAASDATRGRLMTPGDLEELDFLHSVLQQLGFAGPI